AELSTWPGGRPSRTDPPDTGEWHDKGYYTTLSGGSLMATASLASIMDDHVSLSITCLDRLYLNGYVPTLQAPGQLVRFCRAIVGTCGNWSPASRPQGGKRGRNLPLSSTGSVARANLRRVTPCPNRIRFCRRPHLCPPRTMCWRGWGAGGPPQMLQDAAG